MQTTDLSVLIFNSIALTVAWIAAYTGVPPEPAIILAVLMIMDTVVGICAAWRIGEDVTSRKLTIGIVGKFLTLLIPLTMALMVKAMGKEYTILLNTGVTLLVISEGYSVISNVYCYRKGIRLPEIDGVSIIAASIRRLVDLKK